MTKPTEWSKAVKIRDGKCMKCSSLNNLHAHHIKPKATHPELKYEITNGMTLCYTCHKAEHEHNRPIRIRSYTPQRKTLLRKIAELKEEVAILRAYILRAYTGKR